MHLLDEVYWYNSLRTWLVALTLAVFSCLVLLALKRVLIHRVGRLAKRTTTDFDDMVIDLVRKTRTVFIIVVSFYAASHYLDLSEGMRRIIRVATMLTSLIQVGIWGNGLIGYLITKYARQRLGQDASGSATLGAVRFISNVILWTVVLLLALENFGFDVTALVAGLGVTGIAVALAVQNMLGDMFASLSIVLDKPFEVGDYVIIDQLEGTVEKIGLKTTRVRSLSGEQIIFANADMLKSRIRNLKRMEERRVAFRVTVTTQTPRDVLERIPDMLREIVSVQPETRFDRSHFQSIGESGLVFEVVYFMLRPDYPSYMKAQQDINFGIVKRFQSDGIEFAYPTRLIHVRGDLST
jgi:small-conductance mechanosensitive channel